MVKEKRNNWPVGAAQLATEKMHAGPTNLRLQLVGLCLGSLNPPAARPGYIHAQIGLAKADIARIKTTAAREEEYVANLRRLRLMAAQSDFDVLRLRALRADVLSYLMHYGDKDAAAPSVFMLMVRAMNIRYALAKTTAARKRLAAEGAWLGNWYPKFSSPANPSAAQLDAAWNQWQHDLAEEAKASQSPGRW